MPQADHSTYLPIIFWFSLIFTIGYILLGTETYASLISTDKIEVSNQHNAIVMAIFCEKSIAAFWEEMAFKGGFGYKCFVGEKKTNLGRDPIIEKEN